MFLTNAFISRDALHLRADVVGNYDVSRKLAMRMRLRRARVGADILKEERIIV